MTRVPLLPVALWALLFVAACAGGPSTASPAGNASPTVAAAPGGTAAAGCGDDAGGTAVSVVDFAFEPGSVDVSVGSTVTWTNNGDAPHTVTFDDVDCGQIESGDTVSRTFDAAGTFEYVCTLHPQMTATVNVGQ